MKRFFKQAEAAACEGGFEVLLDGKRVKTPAKEALIIPTEALAQAVAAEWNAQKDEIDPSSMPLMQLVSTALDRVAKQRADIEQIVAAYAGTELLCYRADQSQAALAESQQEKWQPILDWASEKYGVNFVLSSGIMHVDQPENSQAKLQSLVTDMDVYQLTAMADLVQIMGSYVLCLALFEGRLTADEAYELSDLEELWQAKLWGRDEEAQERRDRRSKEVITSAKFYELSRVA